MEEIIVAVKGLIINKGKALMVKRSDNDNIGAGTWEMPGGKIEFGEKLEEALTREVKEEVGIDITIEKLLYSNTFLTSSSRQIVIIVYICNTEQENIILSDEHTDFIWASKVELRENLNKEILSDLEKHKVFTLENLK